MVLTSSRQRLKKNLGKHPSEGLRGTFNQGTSACTSKILKICMVVHHWSNLATSLQHFKDLLALILHQDMAYPCDAITRGIFSGVHVELPSEGLASIYEVFVVGRCGCNPFSVVDF